MILGAGGAFPIALYDAGFNGIVPLAVGVLRLPTAARRPASAPGPARST